MGTITESAKAFMPKLSEIRRDFHMHPEVSQHEERTEGDGMRRSI